MVFRDFTAEAAERARERGDDSIEFVLGGHRFHCIAQIPFGASMDFAAAPDWRLNLTGFTQGLIAFLQAIVVEEDREHVADAVRSDDFQAILDLMRWVGEQYSGRPTEPSSDSADGQQETGRGSSSKPDETDKAA